MKKYFSLIVVCCVFSACNYVEPPYTIPGPNGCTTPQPDFTPRPNPVRKVLIEDFTGHNCGACPNGHVTLSGLIDQYQGQVIGVALHSLNMDYYTAPTVPNPDNSLQYDFRTKAATLYDELFGISTIGIPNGYVNRKKVGNSYIVGHPSWGSAVSEILASPPQLDIQLKNFWDPADSSICSYASVDVLENLSGSYKLVLLLTESKIINWQKWYGNNPVLIPDYEHNYVLRTTLTSYWGAQLTSEADLKMGDNFIDGYSVSIKNTDWNLNNLYVVGYVYNNDTKEIIQVEEQKVIP